jgi:tetratricopeptide (TPR) repeat protein/serine/threonine protein kinase
MAANLLEELIRRWQEAQQQGRPLTVEELCADCPQLTEALRQAVAGQQPTGMPAPGTCTVSRLTPPSILELAPGQTPVPGYRLVSLVGRGSFGQVWRAIGPGGFSVAMKFVPLDGEHADFLELRSLEVMKDIRHAQLLAMFGAWHTEDMLIVAMELGESTLFDRANECLRQGIPGIPREELLEYMRDAAKGIDFLNNPRHSLSGKELVGIQHRDIKPQNLLLVGGSVKVADFGLAKILEKAAGTNSGSMTAAYAPPECFKGKTTSRSDQYSLAVTYCQLRGGKLPFSGHSVGQIMMGHVSKPPDLSMIPENERPALARALAKDPEDRFPSCRAFVKALEEGVVPAPAPVRDEGGIPASGSLAVSAATPDLLGSVPTIPPAQGTPWQQEAEPRPRRPALWPWAAGLLAAAVVVAAAYSFLSFLRKSPEPTSAEHARRTEPRLTTHAEPTKTAAVTKPVEPPPEPEPVKKEPIKEPEPVKKEPVKEPEPVKKEPVKDPAQVKKEKAAAHYKEGTEALAKNERERAIDSFTAALDLDPTNVTYRCQRGKAYLEAHDYARAIDDFSKAIELDERNAAAYAQRGRAHNELKEYARAIEDLNAAIDLDPGDAAAYASRGFAYAQRARVDNSLYEEALRDLSKAIELNPRNAVAYRNRGLVYEWMKDPAKALDDYTKAIEADPNYAAAYVSRGLAYSQRRLYDKALDDFNKGLDLDRKSVPAYNGRGLVYAKRLDYHRAVEDFTQAIRIDPKFVTAYENRAAAYRKLKMSSEAEADLEQARKLKAETEDR